MERGAGGRKTQKCIKKEMSNAKTLLDATTPKNIYTTDLRIVFCRYFLSPKWW